MRLGGWPFRPVRRTVLEHGDYEADLKHEQADADPDHIGLYAPKFPQELLSRFPARGPFALDLGELFFRMPEVNVVGAGPRDDPPDDVGGKVLGDVERHGRTDGIDHGVHIHLSVEKPEEGLENEGRPMPCQGELWSRGARKFFECRQVPVGIRAEEGLPEVCIRLWLWRR